MAPSPDLGGTALSGGRRVACGPAAMGAVETDRYPRAGTVATVLSWSVRAIPRGVVGSTPDFGSCGPGSNPGGGATTGPTHRPSSLTSSAVDKLLAHRNVGASHPED